MNVLNNIGTRRAIYLELKDDLYQLKYSSIYDTEQANKIESTLFEANENTKNYYHKDHKEKIFSEYDSLLKGMIIFAENVPFKNFLDRYAMIVGTYALISHIESPLYYLERINLNNYSLEDIANMALVMCDIPSAYHSFVAPFLGLPEVQERIREFAEEQKVGAMKKMVDNLICYVQNYQHIDKSEESKDIQMLNEEVNDFLNITSEQGYTFMCSENESELASNNVTDRPNSLNLVRLVLTKELKKK